MRGSEKRPRTKTNKKKTLGKRPLVRGDSVKDKKGYNGSEPGVHERSGYVLRANSKERIKPKQKKMRSKRRRCGLVVKLKNYAFSLFVFNSVPVLF